VLFVTHDFNMLPGAMRRAVFLDGGRIVYDGPSSEALTGENLSRLFRYPLETFQRGGRRFISFG
jgi:ABC-type cobalamin/Fe3+-siderophores transport system ATPase subunit